MDLVERGLDRAANGVLNGDFSATRRIQDCDGIAALPFFMSLRAAIRAVVTAARRDLGAANDRSEFAASAKRYFDLALELLAPAQPTVVCTGGLSGTGKTLLARALAPSLAPVPGALVLRSDVERKALLGVAEHDRLPADAYRAETTERVLVSDAGRQGRARRARRPFGHRRRGIRRSRKERAAIETAAAAAGARFRGLFLIADLATRLQRVATREADASDADAAIARRQEEFDLGALGWTRVDASGSPEATLTKAPRSAKNNARAALFSRR